MEASLRCWLCDVTAFTQSLTFTRALFVSAGLKARVQRAVLPALESELREQEELQERFERAGAHTGAPF